MRIQVPEATLVEIKEALFKGQKIQAIKLYREQTQVSLVEAKNAIEELEVELRSSSPEKFSAAPAGKGCLGMGAMICIMAIAVGWWLFGK